MISEAELREELVGRDLERGSYDLTRWKAWLTADAIEADPPNDGVAHPMFTYWVGQGGMAVTLEEFFAWCHAVSDDGIMLGSAEIEIERPLLVDERFTVTGAIDDVTRKHGSSGTFDLVAFHLDLTDEEELVAARLGLTFVYPRRDAP